jgi:hypothetical protein
MNYLDYLKNSADDKLNKGYLNHFWFGYNWIKDNIGQPAKWLDWRLNLNSC